MPSVYLLETEKVIRYVKKTQCFESAEGKLCLHNDVFRLREGEEALSVTWCEYFGGSPEQALRCAIKESGNSLRINKNAFFAVGIVAEIRAAVAARAPKVKLRFLHEPDSGNDAHTSIKHWHDEDELLLQTLADETWSEVLSVAQIGELQNETCVKSDRAPPHITTLS